VSERLLNAKEVADRLAVPESWIREATRDGRLPHIALGRYRRYRWPEIETWIEEQRSGGRLAKRARPSL
jgi:excisionase family DNA binding protein